MPIPVDVESVRETVLTPERATIFLVHRLGYRKRGVRCEDYRGDGSGRRNSPIFRIPGNTVRLISVWTITRVQPPESFRISLPFLGSVLAKSTSDLHRVRRRKPVVESQSISVVTQVKITVGHLMNKNGSGSQPFGSGILFQRPFERLPASVRQRLFRRAEA